MLSLMGWFVLLRQWLYCQLLRLVVIGVNAMVHICNATCVEEWCLIEPISKCRYTVSNSTYFFLQVKIIYRSSFQYWLLSSFYPWHCKFIAVVAFTCSAKKVYLQAWDVIGLFVVLIGVPKVLHMVNHLLQSAVETLSDL